MQLQVFFSRVPLGNFFLAFNETKLGSDVACRGGCYRVHMSASFIQPSRLSLRSSPVFPITFSSSSSWWIATQSPRKDRERMKSFPLTIVPPAVLIMMGSPECFQSDSDSNDRVIKQTVADSHFPLARTPTSIHFGMKTKQQQPPIEYSRANDSKHFFHASSLSLNPFTSINDKDLL
jgi:hypothetical protein